VAIVRVSDLPKWSKPLALGDSATLETGQFIMSIGNSLGLFQTMGFGILSYKARTIPDVAMADVTGMLQHQSITHPGNSGGPIFDLQGRVIGMCQLGLRTYNIGLSIPVNKVDKLANKMYDTWLANAKVVPWAAGGNQ
jgi:S1-C subfamily serine protease